MMADSKYLWVGVFTSHKFKPNDLVIGIIFNSAATFKAHQVTQRIGDKGQTRPALNLCLLHLAFPINKTIKSNNIITF